MSILEQIRADMNDARKNKSPTLIKLSTLFAEVEKVGKDKNNGPTSDADAIAVTKKFVEKLQETQALASVPDLQKVIIGQEIALYNKYLPQQLGTDAMKKIIADNSLVGVPAIMQYFKANYAGQYNGQILSAIAKSKTL